MVVPPLTALFSGPSLHLLRDLSPFSHSELLHQLEQFPSHEKESKYEQEKTKNWAKTFLFKITNINFLELFMRIENNS